MLVTVSCGSDDTIHKIQNVNTVVCVSHAGNDSNAGTAGSPFRSVSYALNFISMRPYVREVRVESGNWSLGSGITTAGDDAMIQLNRSYLLFSGGWDSAFSKRVSVSVFDTAGAGEISVLSANGLTNTAIDGFVLKATNLSSGAANWKGAGITIRQSSWLSFSNISIERGSGDSGGAIYAELGNDLSFFNVTTFSNSARYQGGSFAFIQVNGLKLTASVRDSWAVYRGGALLLDRVSNARIKLVVSNAGLFNDVRGCAVFVTGSKIGPVFDSCVFNGIQSGGSILHFENSGGAPSGVVISNCRFAGTGAETAINDADNGDLTRHALFGNVFVTNSLAYIYRDGQSGLLFVTETDLLNDTNTTGASYALSNVAE